MTDAATNVECSCQTCLYSLACCRRTAEGQLKRILLKHFPEDLGAVNGSRGFERAFREMLWASEASTHLCTPNMHYSEVMQAC